MIYYLSPVKVGTTISGGTRKLWDHVEILKASGRPASVLYNEDARKIGAEGLVVVPEVYGWGIDFNFHSAIPRVAFVQNPYLIDWGVPDPTHHPYDHCPYLVAILTESDHSTDIINKRFPDLEIPVIRTHSSGNGRMGKRGPFSWGGWPRKHVVMYFEYKHKEVLDAIFSDLHLPEGWELECLTGRTDEEIAKALRTGAIFLAPNQQEGMCAPTSEAMISGAMICGWYGGGTEEYLGDGRAWIARQDDIYDLRHTLELLAETIDRSPWEWAAHETEKHSTWFQRTYSRKRECEELCEIMDELTALPAPQL